MNSVALINTAARFERFRANILAFCLSARFSHEWSSYSDEVRPRVRRARTFPKTISFSEISAIALRSHPGITLEDIQGRSRCAAIMAARKHAIRLIKDMRPDASYPDIGRFLNRDHTTIMVAYRGRRSRGAVAA